MASENQNFVCEECEGNDDIVTCECDHGIFCDHNTCQKCVEQENQDDDCDDCDECGLCFYTCKHGTFCNCHELNFRGENCILCLFDGEVYNDQYDSLHEVLDGIAYRAYELGKKYAKTGIEKPELSKKLHKSSKNSVKALYKLFMAGFENEQKFCFMVKN